MIIDTPKLTDIQSLMMLWKEAFDDTESYINTFFDTAFSPNRCRTVKSDDNIVAALYWLDCELDGHKIAYIYAVATAKPYRGKGICASLMDDTHRHLAEHGYFGALLVPGNKKLFDMYEKLGYRTACYIGEFNVIADHTAIDLRCIDKEEYAALRRKYLPLGGVIQEKENLELANTFMKFYTGKDFLLAARIDKQQLICIELLGNIQAAAGIVSALECKSGKFCIPDGNIPFAMYRALCTTSLLPRYFGFAFD